MRKWLVASASLLTLLTAVPAVASNTITDIVATSGGAGEFDKNRRDYDILLNAVIAAGLAETLADPEIHWTVFAPNDGAFIKLARDLGYHGRDEAGAFEFIAAALTELGGGELEPVLIDVLTFHVVPKRVTAFDFIVAAFFRHPIPTVLGVPLHPFFFGLVDQDPDLRNPRLTVPINVKASNGIIHTINRVLIPVDL